MSVQLILKNSSVQDKAATAQQLEIGEIALNYHESGPFLQCKDTAGQVWRIGGVIVADEAPGQPQPGTWWFETDTKGLYFYDGTGWTEITGGGGGAGDITAVVAGEGLSGGGNSGSVTLDADLDLTKGLEFTVSGVPGSKIAIKPGANISFDTDGSLRADVGGASIKGSVDLTGATIPSPVSANDGYYNTGSGTLSTEWQAATGLGAISVEPSDLVVFNGTDWTFVPAAPSAVASVFGRVGAIVATEGDYDIGQLGDVDTTSAVPTNGDVLQYDGTNWVPVNETVAVPVQSVHGRTGAVVSAEGDYDLDQLGDVDLTSTPPVNNDVLQYNGSAWVPVTGTSLGYWDRTGTVLSAANTGDQIQLTGALDVNDQPINTTVVDGDIDLDANGAGLIQVTEFNLSQVPIVTQHDIGTDANEVPLNGMLGGMAFQDPASVSIDAGVIGVNSGTAADPSLSFSGDPNTGLFSPGADTLAVSTNGGEHLRITSDGKVGLGTSVPGNYLAGGNNLVVSTTGSTGITIAAGASSNASLYFADGASGTAAYRGYISYNHASDNLVLGSSGIARATIDSYFRLASGTTGIQFNGDTAAANALDDYEEGTWVPTLTRDGTAPSISYTTQTGSYVKIGKMVFAMANFQIASISASGSGLNQLTGLPFTASSTPSAPNSRWIGVLSNNQALASADTAYVIGNNTVAYFYDNGTGAASADYGTGTLWIVFTYQASA